MEAEWAVRMVERVSFFSLIMSVPRHPAGQRRPVCSAPMTRAPEHNNPSHADTRIAVKRGMGRSIPGDVAQGSTSLLLWQLCSGSNRSVLIIVCLIGSSRVAYDTDPLSTDMTCWQ